MSLIDDLNDNCFALTTEFLVAICQEIEVETGRKPSLEELCELLGWGLRSCSADILEGADPGSIIELKPKLRSKRTMILKPGDLLAVPGPGGKFYFILFITKNRFGDAYGVFEGRHSLRPPSRKLNLRPMRYPVYCGPRHQIEGRWRRLGNRPDLLGFFPSNPEIFHRKSDHPENPLIGPFGTAETCDNTFRQLSEAEAVEIGLQSGEYESCLLVGQFEAFLGRKFGGA